MQSIILISLHQCFIYYYYKVYGTFRAPPVVQQVTSRSYAAHSEPLLPAATQTTRVSQGPHYVGEGGVLQNDQWISTVQVLRDKPIILADGVSISVKLLLILHNMC